MPPLVRLDGVGYRYRDGTAALSGIDLRVEAGEYLVLAGASGSGKSTLLRLLNGLIPHLHGGEVEGRVVVAGHDAATTPPAVLGRQVGLVFQDPAAQCVGTTVGRDLAFGPACQGLGRDEIGRRAAEAAAALGIEALLHRAPHTLSGGEVQRVAIAAALALRPALLALDEPFAFLDAAGAAGLRAILRGLRAAGVTVVVAEHRLAEVAADATRLVVLRGGRPVADGRPAEVLASADLEGWGLERPAAGAASPVGRAAAAGPAVLAWEGVWAERGGRAVLRGVDLAVAAGEIVALLGANGAGKSSLLRTANGLLRPVRGVVRVAGRPVGRRPTAEMARAVGLAGQQPGHALFAPTVREELAAGPTALGRPDPARCAALAERFGLTALLDRPPQRLSAGEQRRTLLAATLASRPAALLLDEPTAGQDAAGRRTLAALIAGTAAEGTAVVVATHDWGWAARLDARPATLAGGRIVAGAAGGGADVAVGEQAGAGVAGRGGGGESGAAGGSGR